MTSIKSITVFGGSGFLGRHIIRLLAQTGATIRVPTRDPENALLLKPMGDVGQIVPIATRLASDEAIAKAIGRSEAVINLVGILYEHKKGDFDCVHHEFAANVARKAQELDVKRLIHISALGVSSQSPSLYARSKAAGEAAVRNAFPHADIMRPSIVFGPEDNFFNRFAGMARFMPFLPLIGGGHTRFQPVYVGDVAAAVAKILNATKAGQTYELAGPQVYSFRQLLERMLQVLELKRYLIPMPFGLASLQASLMELLPKPPLTRDQLKLLRTDNVLGANGSKTLQSLGVTPTALEVILPTYLQHFKQVKTQPLAA